VRNKDLTEATGAHFNLPGHTITDMKVTIVEKISSDDPQKRKIRERYIIQKFGTKWKGMNRKT
jgi:hypothetical protein